MRDDQTELLDASDFREDDAVLLTPGDVYNDPFEPENSDCGYAYCGSCQAPIPSGEILHLPPINMDDGWGGWWMRQGCECPTCGVFWMWWQRCNEHGIYDRFSFVNLRRLEGWERECFPVDAAERKNRAYR